MVVSYSVGRCVLSLPSSRPSLLAQPHLAHVIHAVHVNRIKRQRSFVPFHGLLQIQDIPPSFFMLHVANVVAGCSPEASCGGGKVHERLKREECRVCVPHSIVERSNV